MTVTQKVIQPSDVRLGRVLNHDSRSKNYPARGLLGLTQLEPKTKTWRRGAAYDQGNTSQCVAYTGKGLLNTATASGVVSYETRSKYSTDTFYHGAQVNDEWEGEGYNGTSALGLSRYLLDAGIIESYSWNFSLIDTLLCLSHVGPVGIGIWWKTGMWNTDANGFIHLTGSYEGGHEVELIGINVPGKYVIGMNSWGTDWGVNGRFKLSWEDLGIALGDEGDSVVLTAKVAA